jgi:hypothetical protein
MSSAGEEPEEKRTRRGTSKVACSEEWRDGRKETVKSESRVDEVSSWIS